MHLHHCEAVWACESVDGWAFDCCFWVHCRCHSGDGDCFFWVGDLFAPALFLRPLQGHHRNYPVLHSIRRAIASVFAQILDSVV